MYELNPTEAQTIVERMMKDIPYNINIMNHSGVIIGSGDPSRIGTTHQGAVEAIKQGRTIEIYEEDDLVKKGINIPIDINGEIIGVVGISGEVAETRPFGNLLKSTVILLINQSIDFNKEAADQSIKQQFFHQVINRDTIYTPELIQRALQYEIVLTKPSLIVCVDAPAPTRLRMNDPSAFHISAHSLCVVIQDERQLNSLSQDIRSRHSNAFISISQWNDTIAAGYIQAKSAMRIVKGLNMNERLIYYSSCELTANMLASLHSSTPMAFDQQLFKLDKEMIHTLQVYLNCNLNLNETASQLMIHRNTLSYRLSKIHSITGKDPKNLLDRIELLFMLIHHSS
ncbi:CdaR family transcriptional regulator [Paenibacillus xylaniclasticus]|uniref:CdaR family transcriptional regulator n=1 Tax=Paenibacillus xylaniclasticus TaxID=588083 RepID=UPI000FDA9C79|nr:MULTISPECIES: sugar diacid recognition domain-containing protein [Paenibacillus]GFN33991.1 transcriptional regulator [Paenibacillus curdlanolyticus]